MSPTRSAGARAVIAGILGAALIAAPIAATPAFGKINSTEVFINEIHYDNVGTDSGEAIEIAAAPGTDLTGWSVVLYNGSNGTEYGSTVLTETVGDSAVVTIAYGTNGLQNGSPDGVALVDEMGAVVEFLSYEGSFVAVGGAADGLTSTDIGVEEDSETPVGSSLQRTGAGDTGDAFTWSAPAPDSFGAINVGQTFAGITGEEPGDGDPGPGDPGPGDTDVVAFINEFHYDNAGADVGETIEIAATPGANLTGWSVVLYNGNNGATYGSLPLSGIVGDTATVVVDAPGLQNGSPDGFALVDAAGGVVEFLSYEGVMTATNGPANGMTSVDVGVQQASSTAIGLSLQRTGTGEGAGDFTWVGPLDDSFGTLNTGQTFAGISGPEDGDGGTGEVLEVSIAEIQGEGTATPLDGRTVTTTGIVTAAYPTGGYNGYVIQTQGTGIIDESHTASDALFVFSRATVALVEIGALIEVTGQAGEFSGQTQISVASPDDLTILDAAPAVGVTPAEVGLPETEEEREVLESMLLQPQGAFTVTNTFITNRFAEVGLASGNTPLIQPTEIARPGTVEYDAAVADNAARSVVLDDGASVNFFGAGENTPLPYLTGNVVTVGAPVTFTSPVIFDFRNGLWKLQPTAQLTVDNAASVQPVTFGNIREAKPQNVGGDVSIASFNVLNYFSTTGDELDGCQYFTDREGNPISVRTGCLARGAANDENLARQEVKIVNAINTLGADVVALSEIENSAAFGKDRDEALATLVNALNAAIGETVWAFVPSPAAVPEAEDVIRNAFIYRTAAIEAIGESSILLGSPAYGNAREPLAQAFRPVGAPTSATFLALANHFKSKGSGSGADADQGDGQGASNASRVAQAEALVDFAGERAVAAGTELVYLMGDFNSYTLEDPMQVFYEAGYTNIGATTGKYSYSFGGQSGSLDHILGSPAATEAVTGADIWNINAGEAVALEYSRYNYNASLLYDESVFRSSDHDPILVGLDLPDAPDAMATPSPSGLGKAFEDLITAPEGTIDPGSELTLTVGAALDGAAVWVWMFSPAEQLGDWQEVAPDGTVTVTLPADALPKTSRIAVYTGDGELIGWTTIKATPPGLVAQ